MHDRTLGITDGTADLRIAALERALPSGLILVEDWPMSAAESRIGEMASDPALARPDRDWDDLVGIWWEDPPYVKLPSIHRRARCGRGTPEGDEPAEMTVSPCPDVL